MNKLPNGASIESTNGMGEGIVSPKVSAKVGRTSTNVSYPEEKVGKGVGSGSPLSYGHKGTKSY